MALSYSCWRTYIFARVSEKKSVFASVTGSVMTGVPGFSSVILGMEGSSWINLSIRESFRSSFCFLRDNHYLRWHLLVGIPPPGTRFQVGRTWLRERLSSPLPRLPAIRSQQVPVWTPDSRSRSNPIINCSGNDKIVCDWECNSYYALISRGRPSGPNRVTFSSTRFVPWRNKGIVLWETPCSGCLLSFFVPNV